jgi:L-asparagine oxygenase
MGIILFKNLDIGFVPKTPATPFPNSIKEASSDKSSMIFLEYAHKFGYPVSYMQEQNGQLVQNILPVHKTETQQISTSSKVELALHTETAFHPYKPDYVLLFCLRGDPNAVTTYANVDDIVKKLDLWVIATLSKKWFTTNIDISFRTKGQKDKNIPISVLEKTEDGYNFIYDYTFVKANDELGRAALEKLHEAVSECIQEVVLETGDLLVIDNNKTIHGRKPFQARYDGTDRWVQRILVRKELPPSDQIDGHIIITEF